MENDIRIKDLFFGYTRQPALENVNLSVSSKEFASIVGPNGGGKTTLLKLILGLIRPNNGIIEVLGGSPEKVRHHIGYMPQYAHLDMRFPATVKDVVLMGRLSGKKFWFGKKDSAKAMQALEKVDMAGYRNSGFNALSGGQKQRVLIARALCTRPRILLLDEPTANVDHETGESLFSILSELNHEMTILLVSHDIGLVSKYVKHVICVNRQVVTHPTAALEGGLIKDIYNGEFKLVRHDRRCIEEGGYCRD
ncbi:MAG: ABC transporter ATP-binding protein [Desulfobacter sp.]|nr:MAG: ABC transporter ATP-binding protein [Desulfobacter sp.]